MAFTRKPQAGCGATSQPNGIPKREQAESRSAHHSVSRSRYWILIALGMGIHCAFANPATLWREGFDSPAPADILGGEWTIANGVCQGRSADPYRSCFYHPLAAREIEEGTVEARVRVSRRLGSTGWSSAGIALRTETNDLWLLTVTEGPDRERHVDLIESLQGRWQAQAEPGTRLAPAGESGPPLSWAEGVWYRLRLQLTGDGIAGTVLDDSGKSLWSRSFRFDSAPAVRAGRPGLLIRGAEAQFDDGIVSSPLPLGIRCASQPPAAGKMGSVAMVLDDYQGEPWRKAGMHLSAALQDKGWGVRRIDAASVCSPQTLHPANVPLLVVPNAHSYPTDGIQPLLRYLRHGGRVLFLGAPALANPVATIAGTRIARPEYDRRLAGIRPGAILADGAAHRIAWSLAAKSKACGASFLPEQVNSASALRYAVKNLDGWAVYRSPELPGMFAKNHALLCLRAKGDAGTPALSVELAEKDGSRWMASVPLSADWQWRALSMAAFAYWPDSPTKTARGAPGDRCKPSEVVRIAVGLIESRDGVQSGANGFWIESIGTAENPLGEFPLDYEPPVIESVSPIHKLYPCQAAATWHLSGCSIQTMASADLGSLPQGEIWSPLPRPANEGFGRSRKWRILPVAEVFDQAGTSRGLAAWMQVSLEGDRRGSIAACVGVSDPAFFASGPGIALTGAALHRMSLPFVLAEGGADRFLAQEGSSLQAGATLMPCGTWSGPAAVKLALSSPGKAGFELRKEVLLAPGVGGTITCELPPQTRIAGTWHVRVEAARPGSPDPVDVLEHELRVEPANAEARRDGFVRVRDGEFVIGDRIWRIQGVNYWPRYVAGMELADYGRSWLANSFYDARQVEADLAKMNDLGINLVSVQLGQLDNAENLRDFLHRCRAHRIWVNGFLSPASPVVYNESAIRAFIEAAGLRDEPALFAYDIIWEPGNHLFNEEGRQRWTPDWNRWVQERYGDLESAAKDWGYAPERDSGQLLPPTDHQMREDGPWRVMVAAYRRFMDDFTSRKWNDAVTGLRAIDPNHLVSFRQGNTLPQDFALTGPVKHVDFVSPEGYAITNLEHGEDVAGFITRYVKMTSGGKPVYWAEFGRSVWDGSRMRSDSKLIDLQGNYNAMFHRMAVWSGAQGVAPWWWPGGYRINEQSDFGILDPDGTPRPAAKLYLEHPLSPAPGKAPEVEWLEVDRDAHPGGYWHIAFHQGWEAYRRARLNGRLLQVRTPGTGTTSANAPLTAVGNVPYHGSNPPKYLNAEFNRLTIRDASGTWRDVPCEGHATIEVKAGEPIRVNAGLGNLGEAAWLPPGPTLSEGAVYLSTRSKGVSFQIPIAARVPSLANADLGEFEIPAVSGEARTVVFEVTARNRCWFGEKRRVKLVPR